MGKIILTGDRPTGKLHVGHYVGSLRRRVELQNSGEFDKIYIMIADAQALTDNADNPEKVRQNILEVALDYLSCGLDPEKSTIFIQSQIPELCELSFYYMNLVTVSRLQRNPTVKSEIQMRNEGNTVFTYLDAFCQPEHFERYLPDYANLDELKAHYQRGGLGDVKVKKFLNNVLQETLEPIRNRRKELEKDIPAIYEMLKKGSEEAEKVAAQTLADVKAAMKINYFDDLDLIRSQAERYGK